MTADNTGLKYFAGLGQALTWSLTELVASLSDDLHRMEELESEHYVDYDINTLRDKIHDISVLQDSFITIHDQLCEGRR